MFSRTVTAVKRLAATSKVRREIGGRKGLGLKKGKLF